MPLTISVPDALELRGYLEIPRGEVVTVADLVDLLQHFDQTLPVCGKDYSHNLNNLRLVAVESETLYDEETGNDAKCEVVYLHF